MQVTINNKKVECQEGQTILQLLEKQGIEVPTLCYHPNLKPEGRCRICLVDVDGKLMTSCDTKIKNGMNIITDSKRVLDARRLNTELILSQHIEECSIEPDKHDLWRIARDLGLTEIRFKELIKKEIDTSNSCIVIDHNKCILCGRCVQTCQKMQEFFAIEFVNRGIFTKVTPAFELPLGNVACTCCGQCSLTCPVGAIKEKNDIAVIVKALKNKKKHVVVQVAPSIRASIGEEFNMSAGSLVTGKVVAALRRVGFNRVFDTDLGADMTIMEEASEFIERLKKNGPFPMITTCCPAWIKFMEHHEHSLFPNMSSCKSPHEMLGILTKTYYAKKKKIPRNKIVVVSIMPCTAKKFESLRPELNSDVDYVLTTREAAKLIKLFNIDLKKLPDEDFDPTLGISTGAGVMFGASGGVMEAALRTAYEFATGKAVPKLKFEEIRGMEGIKEGSIKIDDKKINFAVAHGGKNIRKLLEKKEKYHFIEMMACRGGCIGGGGQPIPTTKEILKKRMQAIYKQDAKLPLRKSHENPVVKKIYKEFLGKPFSKKAHRLLHTRYTKRSMF
jgi:NADH-quinone oxidoreductase subunit G/NADP-reducing hydrogenase subunit HndD